LPVNRRKDFEKERLRPARVISTKIFHGRSGKGSINNHRVASDPEASTATAVMRMDSCSRRKSILRIARSAVVKHTLRL